MNRALILSGVVVACIAIGIAFGRSRNSHPTANIEPAASAAAQSMPANGPEEAGLMPAEFLGEHWPIDEQGHAREPDRWRLSIARYEPRVIVLTPAGSMPNARQTRNPYQGLHVIREKDSLQVRFDGRAGPVEWTFIPPNRVHVRCKAAEIDEIREIH